MKLRSVALAMAIAAGMISGACSSGSSGTSGAGGGSSSAGAVGTGGGSSSAGAVGTGGGSSPGPTACFNVTACGGSVVGTWNVTSSCVKVTGQLDLSLVGAGCATAPVTGSLTVSGTWTANSDGTYADNTMTTGEEQFTLAPSCLVISSTQTDCNGAASIISSLGYSSVTCTAAAGGGCTCAATVKQSGGLGLVSVFAATSGNYQTSGNVVSVDGQLPYSYCASGSTMTWTPQTTSPTTTGSIAFQKSGGAGGMGAGGTNAGGTGGDGASGMSAGGTSAGGTSSMAAGSGGMAGGGTAGGGSTTAPCDIYSGAGTPCVAAHSSVRALFAAYSGKLYQVRNASGTTKDISAITAGGVADSAAQDTFCSGTTCVITIIYDQTGKGNDLQYQGSGSLPGGKDVPASATGESIKVGGNKAYSLYIKPQNSYWVDGSAKGVPTGSAPEGMYMVTSGTHYNSGCCFDYGNSEVGRAYKYPGAMDALNFSNTTSWGTGAGSGPWIMADLEAGLFTGQAGKNTGDPTQSATFVTAVLKNNGTTEYALRGGAAPTGNLSTYYKGALPAGGWSPMRKEGAIVLGSGGDCCATNTNLSQGTFYEGCIVTGYPSDATENAVQANIVAAGYSK
jgi:non-reducing end alpha-L-arabinofuranosidase